MSSAGSKNCKQGKRSESEGGSFLLFSSLTTQRNTADSGLTSSLSNGSDTTNVRVG